MDSRNFLFGGIGDAIQKVTTSTGNVKANTTTITTGSRSEYVSAHDCKELMFAIVFAVVVTTGTIVIERASAVDATVYDTHETITVDGLNFKSWAAGETLLGFYRIYNNSGQSVVVYQNKRVR